MGFFLAFTYTNKLYLLLNSAPQISHLNLSEIEQKKILIFPQFKQKKKCIEDRCELSPKGATVPIVFMAFKIADYQNQI